MKIKLKAHRNRRGVATGGKPILLAEPFYLGLSGVFVHRVRHVNDHGTHFGVVFWCGNIGCVSAVDELYATPPKGRYVCSRCEMVARLKGLSPKVSGSRVGCMRPVAARAGAGI